MAHLCDGPCVFPDLSPLSNPGVRAPSFALGRVCSFFAMHPRAVLRVYFVPYQVVRLPLDAFLHGELCPPQLVSACFRD